MFKRYRAYRNAKEASLYGCPRRFWESRNHYVKRTAPCMHGFNCSLYGCTGRIRKGF